MSAATAPDYLEDLLRTASDTAGFVALRRRLIGELIARHDDERGGLRALQGEIDCGLAGTLAPRQTLALVTATLAERVTELQQLTEQLKALETTDRSPG